MLTLIQKGTIRLGVMAEATTTRTTRGNGVGTNLGQATGPNAVLSIEPTQPSVAQMRRKCQVSCTISTSVICPLYYQS